MPQCGSVQRSSRSARSPRSRSRAGRRPTSSGSSPRSSARPKVPPPLGSSPNRGGAVRRATKQPVRAQLRRNAAERRRSCTMRRFSSLLVLAMAAIGIASAVSGGAAAMKATHHCLPKRHTCAAKKTPSTKKPAPSAPVQPVTAPAGSSPLHTNIVATTFWVGEIFDADLSDGSQACSTYDSEWAYHWSGGADVGTDPSTDCAGAPIGGCDGVPSGTGSSFTCATQKRTAANGYFPTDPSVHPAQNPFYVDLPFDDVNDPVAFRERCQVIPWADQFPAADCARATFSYMKNHWVQITGPNGNTCYGQVEDAGPSS